MFDTHCHLNLDEFDNKLENTINKARESGVECFMIPGVDYSTSKKAAQIATDFEEVYAAVGIHPTTRLDSDIDEEIVRIEHLAGETVIVRAIGEIGLDYYHLSKDLEVPGPDEQIHMFTAQLKLAVKLNLPVIIHNRQSTEDILSCLNEVGVSNFEKRAVFHCCPAEEELLEYAIKNKIFIGVDGDVTYDDNKKEFVKRIPDDLLVIETDSPYLTPEPVRSEKRFPNTPANLVHTLDAIATARGEDKDKLQKMTFENSATLFAL